MSIIRLLQCIFHLVFLNELDCALGASFKRRYFATKSRYPIINDDDVVINIPVQCTPVHINMVLRHGTRYPGWKDVKGMNEVASFMNQFQGNKAIWRNNIQNGNKFLASIGSEELYNISRRIRHRFATLFSQGYNVEEHIFVATMTARTSQSASAFAFGLFEGTGDIGKAKFQPVAITTTNLTEPQLRFFDACIRYENSVSKNKKIALAEYYQFRDGKEILGIKRKLASKLNIPDHSQMMTEHVQHIFLACAFENAIKGEGEWCSLLDDSDLDIIEFLYDLKNYWKRGYGFEINYKMSCLLLKNITESVEYAVKSLSHTKAIFHFAHSETIIPLLCRMGLFKDKNPLTARNFYEQANRLFRTSNIAPFSANVAVVLYSCSNMLHLYYVQVLVNEIAITLPCCDGLELCPLYAFRQCFESISDECDFQKICELHQPHDEL